jgi:NAD(P)-dependent dehydrogenase (short-subunit alcohol dehydrogenase family)
MAKWTAADIPSQNGRSVVVTGTGGLGYEDALALARAGIPGKARRRSRESAPKSPRRLSGSSRSISQVSSPLRTLANGCGVRETALIC